MGCIQQRFKNRGVALVASLASGACGPPSPAATETEAGTTADSDGETTAGPGATGDPDGSTADPTGDASGSDATESSSDPGTTEPGTTDPGTTGDPTTDPGTTGDPTTGDPTTEPGTTGSTDTGGGNVEYYAFPYFGGLDRLVIRKADFDAGHCTELRLVTPAIDMTWSVTTPQNWAVESASITDSVDGCLTKDPPMGEVEWAVDGMGEVSWDPLPMGQYFPCEVDVDVILDFADMTPWAPAQGALVAVDLPVDGCM